MYYIFYLNLLSYNKKGKKQKTAIDTVKEEPKKVEIVEDEEPSPEDIKKNLEKYQVYDSDDPFVRKDPNDYSSDDDDDAD